MAKLDMRNEEMLGGGGEGGREPTVGRDGGWIDSACVVFGSFFLYMYPKGGGRRAACLSVLSHLGWPLI